MHASPNGRVRSAATALLVAVAIALAPTAPAPAQDVEEPVRVVLEDQPIWQRPSDPLGIRLRVINQGFAPIEGFLVSISSHPVISTRSALHQSFEGNPGAVTSAVSESFDDVVEPGESLVVDLESAVADLTSLASITEGGVYPLTISVSDPSGVVPHDSFTTPLILYPEEPEVPLNLAVVLPLNDLPSRGPDGVFDDPFDGPEIDLEEALAETGWLTGLVTALEQEAGELEPLERTVRVRPRRGNRRRPVLRTIQIPQRGLHLGIAPTPRLIEEMADMASGYRRRAAEVVDSVGSGERAAPAARAVLGRLAALLEEDGVQPLLSPYSFPDLPALSRNSPERIEIELGQAVEVLGQALGLELERDWIFAPAGRIALETLEELRFSNADTARHTLFHPDVFRSEEELPPEGCPEAFASFTCPVEVRTSQGPTVGLVGDQGLQDRLAALVQRADGRLDLQNFFAETAAIRQEIPSVEGRVVHITVPSLWHPTPRVAEQLFAGLRDAPWLRTVTPEEAVGLREPAVRSDEFVQSLDPLRSEPDPTFFGEIAETTTFLDQFRRLQPPEEMVDRLVRNTLVAESRLWWPNAGLMEVAQNYLSGTTAAAENELAEVTIGGPAEINLTSREGEIPLTVSNRTGFPTTLRVRLESPQRDLLLDPGLVPAQQIDNEDSLQFTVAAQARSSGIFRMEVLVETPDGALLVAEKIITIRSTAFNRIALGITLGAFGFLVVFYLLRVFRRRGEETD